jgi:RHS repeat-associated protein
VLKVLYQQGQKDQFYHQYTYDADNRIVDALSSSDGVIWETDAYYQYYRHSVLKRVELGEEKVQGVDYFYTIHGWLKGVNSETLAEHRDPGKDGTISSPFTPNNTNVIKKYTPKDVFGYSLKYYQGDYKSIGIQNPQEHALAKEDALYQKTKNLYNGNISAMVTSIEPFMEDENGVYEGPQATTYGYDQLNRLVSSIAYTSGNTMRTGNDWLGLYETDAYKTSYSYDANGNIMKLTRKDNDGQAMDNFTYSYKSTNNQLLSVSDAVNNNAAKKLGDIQPGQSAENYKYDGIGNLIEDKQEEIKNIAWQANGKVKSVTRTPLSTKPDLEFKYDALGQRVAKIVKPKNPNGELLPESEWETTWYVRDAQGNEMAIYKQNYQTVGTNVYKEQLKVEEFSIYGSSRLGTESPVDNLLTERQFFSSIDNQTKRFNNIQTQSIQQLTFNANNFTHYRGKKQYHLSNHLGNVLATVSDRIIPESMDGLTVSSFKAEIKSASDYYPFGMLMPKRNHKPINIDFGFNGMRKENEWTEGNYDFGARIYDSRSGRWFAVDPLAVKYSFASPFNFVLNSPIQAVDPDGKVVIFINGNHYGDGGSHEYWRQYETRTRTRYYKSGGQYDFTYKYMKNYSYEEEYTIETYAFDKEVMTQFRDNKARYYDGALGGGAPFSTNTNPYLRYVNGYMQAKNDAADIISNLKKDANGNITETIKIVSHSMGGVYSKGFVRGLQDYINDNKIEGVLIEIEVDFAPFQPDNSLNTAVKGVPTFQASHRFDFVAGNKPGKGSRQIDTSIDDNQGHSIFDFKSTVKKLGEMIEPNKKVKND